VPLLDPTPYQPLALGSVSEVAFLSGAKEKSV